LKLEIAYLYDAVYPWVKGGAEKRIYELSQRMVRRGHTVHCYGMKWWQGENEILMDGVHLHGICQPMPLYLGGRRSIKEAAYFAGKVLSAGVECDIIDCQNFPYLSCFSAKFISSSKRQELFITWLEVWGDYWYEYLGMKGILGQSIERVAALLTEKNIAISERTCRDLVGLGVKAVQIVPSGIDWQKIERIIPSEKLSDIICAGRQVRHKNVDLFIEALEMVKSEIPDVRALIIGDGPENSALQSLVRKTGLENNVEFCGFLENYSDALALMKSSRVFASPSTREGFGMAALEANACGLPVVTVKHRMNAVMDLVTEQTGLVCEPTAKALAEGLCRVLEKGDGMRGQCIGMARKYDWDEICERAERVYESGK
jgi:glycosyltransferase involved in cell wall biosynthesis